jgi:BirA family biotin operon repressor/biotin-[acetyl-CoA-carboxylase] ligase
VVRDPPRLLPLATGLAVAEVVGAEATVKWPNDVLLGQRKVAGILVEGRPQERWAVVGIGLNVAVRDEDFPQELRATAGTLGWEPEAIEPTLGRLLAAAETWWAACDVDVIEAVGRRDALRGKSVRWSGGEGRAAGIDPAGRLIVDCDEGQISLEAGEVHLR